MLVDCTDLLSATPTDLLPYLLFSRYSYTHDIEAVSCDEMLVDCTDLLSATPADLLPYLLFSRYSYTHDIEAVSCDEMLVGCTDLLSATPADLLQAIRHFRVNNYILFFRGVACIPIFNVTW